MRLRCKPQFGESPCCIHGIAVASTALLLHPRSAVRPRCTDACASRARARGARAPAQCHARRADRRRPSSPSIVLCRRPEGSRPGLATLRAARTPAGTPTAARRKQPRRRAERVRAPRCRLWGSPCERGASGKLPVPEDDRTPQRRCARARTEQLRHATAAHAKQKPVVRAAKAAIRGSGSAPARRCRAQHRTRLQQTARHVSARPAVAMRCRPSSRRVAAAWQAWRAAAWFEPGLRARGTHGGRAGWARREYLRAAHSARETCHVAARRALPPRSARGGKGPAARVYACACARGFVRVFARAGVCGWVHGRARARVCMPVRVFACARPCACFVGCLVAHAHALRLFVCVRLPARARGQISLLDGQAERSRRMDA